jgi:sugar phosphate isomerase/epimerase
MLGLPTQTPDGTPAGEASPEYWLSQFRAVAAEGFDRVELSDVWLKPALLDSSRRRLLVETAAEAGLEIPAVHIQRVSPIAKDAAEDNLAYGHASIDATAELGASTYSTGLHQTLNPDQQRALWFWTAQGPCDPPHDEETWQLAVGRVRELGRHAAQVGLALSLELYEDTYLGTGDDAVRFIEAVGLENVGLNPDVGNLIRLHRDVEDWRELYAKTLPYANYWHLKNYSRDEDFEHGYFTALPSTLRDGLINYREIISTALSLGYRGIFTMEHYGGDSLSICGENQRYTRQALRAALDNPVPVR